MKGLSQARPGQGEQLRSNTRDATGSTECGGLVGSGGGLGRAGTVLTDYLTPPPSSSSSPDTTNK